METQNVTVPALERALNILEYLAQTRQPASLKMLSEHLGIPTSSVFRLVKNLESRGYLQKQPGDPSYYGLGEKIISLAIVREQGASLSGKAEPYMRDLAVQLNQTVQLAVIKNETFMHIAQTPPPKSSISIYAPLYTALDIHTSASGKLLFGYLTPAQQKQWLEKITFPKMTSKTITDPDVFVKEATLSRSQGYGLDNEEYALGIGCLAVPIFNKDTCVAALGITGPISEYHDPDRFQILLDALKCTTDKLSRALYFYYA